MTRQRVFIILATGTNILQPDSKSSLWLRSRLCLAFFVKLSQCSARVMSHSFDLLFAAIQEAQVRLPAHREDTREHESVLWHNKREADCRDRRP